MSLDGRAVQREDQSLVARLGQGFEDRAPSTASSPAIEAVVDRRIGSIVTRTITPAAARLQHMDDAADDTPIISALRPAQSAGKMRGNARPLPIAQPKQSSLHRRAPRISSLATESQNNDRVQTLRQIERLKSADQTYLEDGIRIFELAKNARRLFEHQEPREKRRLLDFVLSNSTWKGGELQTLLRQPFDMILETATKAAQAKAAGRANLVKSEIWLGN